MTEQDRPAGLEHVVLELLRANRELVEANRELVESNRELVDAVRQLVARMPSTTHTSEAPPAGAGRRPVPVRRRRPEDPDKVRARHLRYRERHPFEWRDRPRRRAVSTPDSQSGQPVDPDTPAGTSPSPLSPPPAPPVSLVSLSPGGPPIVPPSVPADPTDQVAALIEASGEAVVLSDADRRAVRGCSASPEVVAEAFVAAARGTWMGSDRWMRNNLSLRVVVDRLSGYLATRVYSDRVGPPLELVTD
jgi:hypothetical protein